ncbi:azurin [Xenophilus sp. Marseille-Q4582]|uniref:azurin n=1 Tax=Xenophilus sp. Marseille-Q4582 TaxID=2866600 RepID=UPI001CE3BA52|nr:azurin [Xenophilus sp. Marseille-Q4582]
MMLRLLAATAAFALATPFQAASAASPPDCKVQIEGNDAMQFNRKEIVVPKSCQRFTVELRHAGKLPKQAMGHNWVLSKTTDAANVARDGIPAGLDKQYVKPGDARVIAFTRVLGPGETDATTFDVSKLSAGESYTFFCSFPGHSAVMKGVLRLG